MKNTILQYLKTAHKTGEHTLTSGRKSNFYVDVKSLMFNAKFIDLLGHAMCSAISFKWADTIVAVGGMEMGSIPISTAVVIKSNKMHEIPYNHFVVRKNPRTHGTGCQIEGIEYIRNKSVIIVDDVLTSGMSILKTASILEQNGVECKGAIVVVDRQERIYTFPFPVINLFTRNDIITND